ncbi:MAG: hypothetical protein AAF267_06450 [Deinococcota bacterium]
MKKLLVAGFTVLAMALSFAPQLRQTSVNNASLSIGHMLADGNSDTDGD